MSNDHNVHTDIATSILEHAESITRLDAEEDRRLCSDKLTAQLGKAELARGDFAAAEQALRDALARDRSETPPTLMEQLVRAESMILLAIAQARLGRHDEASRTLTPALQLLRGQAGNREAGALVGLTLASALYAQALAEPDQRDALLQEASALLDSLPPQMRTLRSTTIWRERIAQGAQSNPPPA